MDPDREIFGPLVDITAESLVLLASNIANQRLHVPGSGGKLVARIDGSYNIIHVVELEGIKLVIRVPATGWGSGMTPIAAHAMESQVATMRLIRNRTTIPVPEIYALDTTDNNEIGAPYICMSFIPGKTVSEVWSDHSGTVPREELRLRILTSLSRTMAQFSCLTFDQMGSIMDDGSGATREDGRLQVAASGPFDSNSGFLEKSSIPSSNEDVWDTAETKVLEAIRDSLPALDSPPGFVLCLPDFDSQNVLVDDEGSVTGLIDWDLAQTMPRFVGYARYPGWITRDWDPLMYGWSKMADSEDTPETLERYRAYYNTELGKALKWQGDWKFTEKSHIAEAIWIATLSHHNRLEICRRFVQVAAGSDIEALDVLYDIGVGRYGEEDWCILEANLKRSIC
ncbi:kinase-like domain-containing protein [Ilyonectria robusta]|uniref:kinase-like domain-containing protein n=1 Tax=Ilyonectria robusta TaxID=1079257 RepID=UPI001E8DD3F0|nr:kinase-like domain-containing protein [Ilyonectria robusta]KAH8662782.1 kinase-like domain-containing protein [Ilyonectria robusta]